MRRSVEAGLKFEDGEAEPKAEALDVSAEADSSWVATMRGIPRPIAPAPANQAANQEDIEPAAIDNDAREQLFSLDLYMHSTTVAENAKIPSAERACFFFRFLDFPAVRIGGDGEGKSCTFKMSVAELQSLCSTVPLYVVLVDGSLSCLVATAALDLSSYIEKNFGETMNLNEGYVRSSYLMYNLVGRQVCTVNLSLRIRKYDLHAEALWPDGNR